jgi:hypothetical protein
MLCYLVRRDEHIVSGWAQHTFSGLGKGMTRGCGAYVRMLGFVLAIPVYLGLGLKLGSRRGIAADFIVGEG